MTILAPENTLLSDAIVAYLGHGTSPYPRRDIRAVEALTNDPFLALAARKTISEILTYDLSDNLFDTPQGHDLVAEYARTIHPELTQTAIEAIIWNYFIGWR